jgi:hypothetical protein
MPGADGISASVLSCTPADEKVPTALRVPCADDRPGLVPCCKPAEVKVPAALRCVPGDEFIPAPVLRCMPGEDAAPVKPDDVERAPVGASKSVLEAPGSGSAGGGTAAHCGGRVPNLERRKGGCASSAPGEERAPGRDGEVLPSRAPSPKSS